MFRASREEYLPKTRSEVHLLFVYRQISRSEVHNVFRNPLKLSVQLLNFYPIMSGVLVF